MIQVIHSEKDFLALNKPAGIVVHAPHGKHTEEETVVSWLLKHHPEVKGVGDDPENRPGIVHRLDKETSGVLIVPRNQEFFEYLKSAFQNHRVQKTYMALVFGELQGSGVVNKPIGLKPGTVKHSTTAKHMKMIKEAVTEYKTLRHIQRGEELFTLVELKPKTGRTHQLRVHMASLSHPIVGDALYTKREDPWHLGRQFLHAEAIEFTSHAGKRIHIEAELPKELKRIVDSSAKNE